MRKLKPQASYALTDRVLAGARFGSSAGGPFTVSNTAPVPIDKLRAGGLAIVVKTSPADGDVEIFCGNVD